MSIRTRSRRWLAVVIPLILVLAGVSLAGRWALTAQQASEPVETLRAFLEAAGAGDVDAALAMATVEPSGSRELLVPEAMSSDWRIVDVGLQRWSSDIDTSQAWATIVGPQKTELTTYFDLWQINGDWKVVDPYTDLEISSFPLPYFEVNGYTVPVDPEASGGEDFALLPGVYEFYQDPPELFTYAGAPLIALGGSWVEAGGPDDRLMSAAFKGFDIAEGTEPGLNEQVKAYLDECMANPEGPEQFGCPFGLEDYEIDIDGFTAGDDRRWEILEYPQVAAASTLGPIVKADQLALLTRHEGLAHVTVADDYSGEEAVLECPITTDGLYLWLDESGQHSLGPNGDPDGSASDQAVWWEHDYESHCRPA